MALRRVTVQVTAGVVLGLLCCGVSAIPNIVHIIADDLGYSDLSYHNGGITSTPNIDGLIANGVELTQCAYQLSAPCSCCWCTAHKTDTWPHRVVLHRRSHV